MAASGGMSVTYDDMKSAADRLEKGEEDMNGDLENLRAYIRGLADSGFVTEKASESFNDAYEQFQHDISAGLQALSAMAKYLRDAAAELQATDERLVVTYGG